MGSERKDKQSDNGGRCAHQTTCEAKGPSYISVGTVQVRIAKRDCAVREILFTPTKEFSISYAGKEYVVLLPSNIKSGDGKLVSFKSAKGISICVPTHFSGLVEAAVQQCAVEIEANAKCDNCLHKSREGMKFSLLAITIPATDQKP